VKFRVCTLLAAASVGAGAARAQPVLDAPTIESNAEQSGTDFAPEIWAVPDPSKLSIRGTCLPDDLLRLVVEYETDGEARYRALLVYAEPSHRLLFVQWNGPPDASQRASILEQPLAVFEQDSQRRHATIRFRPERDDRIRVQAITPWNERRDVLAGRVGNLCDFAVENRVHD
jgi:hypothetical protein